MIARIFSGLFLTATLALPVEAAIFSTTLSGDQEVPPVNSAATGSASLILNDAQDRLEISIQFTGLDLDGNQTPQPDDDVTVAHIHRAPAGSNGPVVFGFIGPDNDQNDELVTDPVAGTISSGWDLNEGNNTTLAAELPNLFDGDLYVNIHSAEFLNGEIRGQIALVPIPATLPMFAVALAALGLGSWRARKAF
ncbi:MAG: CHRD domain-containing protein [Nitrospira sp.]